MGAILDKASLVITPNAIKESKLYSVVPSNGSGDLSVVRATTATRVNSAGLIEDAPYNLLKYSEAFGNVFWTKSTGATIVSNSVIAPNGTLTADTLVFSTTVGSRVEQAIALLSSIGNYTFSFYAKSDSLKTVGIRTGFSAMPVVNVDITTEWQRYEVTQDLAVAGPGYPQIRAIDTLGGQIYVWGAQLVTGSVAKEYFPTTDRLNVPRLDYTNSTCPSILVEPQRTNLLTYSNTFSNSAWIKLNCSVASNSIMSPDGAQNSTTLTSSVTNTNYLYNAITTANGLYTLSCFVKYLDTNTVNLSMTDFATGDASAKFNFNTGLFNTPIVSGSWTNTTTNVITLTNGWFKISITSQKNAGLSVSSRIDSFDAGKSVYIYGAQLEVGANATSYIPTTTATVTRNADVISKTGISSLINSSEGCFYCELKPLMPIPALSFGYSLSNGTNSELIYMAFTATTNRLTLSTVNSNGVNLNINIDNVNFLIYNKIAINWKQSEFKVFINGSLVYNNSTFNTFTENSLSQLKLSRGDNQRSFEGNLKLLSIYKKALTDTECIALTTL